MFSCPASAHCHRTSPILFFYTLTHGCNELEATMRQALRVEAGKEAENYFMSTSDNKRARGRILSANLPAAPQYKAVPIGSGANPAPVPVAGRIMSITGYTANRRAILLPLLGHSATGNCRMLFQMLDEPHPALARDNIPQADKSYIYHSSIWPRERGSLAAPIMISPKLTSYRHSPPFPLSWQVPPKLSTRVDQKGYFIWHPRYILVAISCIQEHVNPRRGRGVMDL